MVPATGPFFIMTTYPVKLFGRILPGATLVQMPLIKKWGVWWQDDLIECLNERDNRKALNAILKYMEKINS